MCSPVYPSTSEFIHICFVQCKYFRGIQDVLAHPDRHQLRDIEDLKAFGTEHDACPFFVSRRWAEEMDVIVGPYNYLADPVIRRSTKIGK